jgi:hypothetical protein
MFKWHCINKFLVKYTQYKCRSINTFSDNYAEPNGAGCKWHCTSKSRGNYTQPNEAGIK